MWSNVLGRLRHVSTLPVVTKSRERSRSHVRSGAASGRKPSGRSSSPSFTPHRSGSETTVGAPPLSPSEHVNHAFHGEGGILRSAGPKPRGLRPER